MKRLLIFPLLAAAACSPEKEAGPAVERRSEAEILEQAKMAAQAAFQGLSGELGKAITEGGTTHAIPVCSSKAGSLTARIAEEHGVKLVRLSDRPRNPDQRATGEDLEALEAMRTSLEPRLSWQDDETAVVRLPIVLNNALCLKCHGAASEIDDETRAVLAERYPDDEATGYSMDDLRGIWRIEVPAAR